MFLLATIDASNTSREHLKGSHNQPDVEDDKRLHLVGHHHL